MAPRPTSLAGVGVVPCRGSDVVRIVAGGAGLGMDLVLRPGNGDVRSGISIGVVIQQDRQPGQKPVARVAARAVPALSLVDGQFVVGVAAQLPLLEARMAKRLSVADGTSVRRNIDPGVEPGHTRLRESLDMAATALRPMTILALDVGQYRDFWEGAQHRVPVVAGVVDEARVKEPLIVAEIVETEIEYIQIEADRVAGEASLSVVGVRVEHVGEDLRMPSLSPGSEDIRGAPSLAVTGGAVGGQWSPVCVLARNGSLPGAGKDIKRHRLGLIGIGPIRYGQGIFAPGVGRELRVLRRGVLQGRSGQKGASAQDPIVRGLVSAVQEDREPGANVFEFALDLPR